MSEPAAIDQRLLGRFPLPRVAEASSKEDRGRLLVIAGSRELAGAALLAGVAGLRAGAGKLQIATAASLSVALAVAVPEARVIGYPETEDGCIDESGIEPLIGWARDAQAVAIGCGLKHGPPLETLCSRLLQSEAAAPLILDAAILDCLEPLEREVRRWSGGLILLPHAGEMASLLGCEEDEVEADPIGCGRTCADRYGAVVLVKGVQSHVVSPGGEVWRYAGGGPGLGVSGSGDVLAGTVGGLLARGAAPLDALLWAVWAHGEAGRILGEKVGPLGFLAREIAGEVPALLAN